MSESQTGSDDADRLPALYQDRSFWAMTGTQFFGAFNDNLFKQLVLLLALGGIGAAAGEEAPDRQGMAMVIFAAPFLLFSGVAGFFSERISKTRIIVGAKVAEIAVMGLGVTAFLFYRSFGLSGAFAILFLMGMQSAFFGPAKYGILPEMLRESDLPRANGFFLMTTFVAIILGTAVAGFLKGKDVDLLWVSAMACVGIAIVGTFISMLVRPIPPAAPNLRFDKSTLAIPPEMRRLLARDRTLLGAVIVASLFWLLGGMVHPTINALGIRQLMAGDDDAEKWTGLLQACLAVGIATGCLLAGKLSHGRANYRLVRGGAWGVVGCLVLLSLPAIGPFGDVAGHHLLGFWLSLPVLVALGISAGLFVVPLQVVIQTHPPQGQKGRMIAVMNVFTWFGILISGLLYEGAAHIIEWTGLPNASVFFGTSLIILPIALFYRPDK